MAAWENGSLGCVCPGHAGPQAALTGCAAPRWEGSLAAIRCPPPSCLPGPGAVPVRFLTSPVDGLPPAGSSEAPALGRRPACTLALRLEWAFASTDIFAGTKIDPSALVQKLAPDARSVASIRRGAEPRAVLPKKEKLKLRRERWLQKIEAIKLAERQRKAERKRRAAAVVGDLQPLRDALPELLELEAGARQPRARGVSRRPRPAELSRMSAAERLQLLDEERARFRELLASPAYRASPLLAIGQQLARQVQLDSGGQL
ncbi:ribosome biogenesis protein SLX9 homolog isoform X1 [Mustela nigripes]|uniref:ribosome biogenesis protein SLX9 homolog isoform X1 n=1 Tax=Mustela nigripes TaxID=77151 RepID=UPI002816409C|nr:ribosome biogenesis protein SLX9 homolog isoform X1 [Mustela nigripes]